MTGLPCPVKRAIFTGDTLRSTFLAGPEPLLTAGRFALLKNALARALRDGGYDAPVARPPEGMGRRPSVWYRLPYEVRPGLWCGWGLAGVWCGVVWCGVVWCGVVWCGGVGWGGQGWVGVGWCRVGQRQRVLLRLPNAGGGGGDAAAMARRSPVPAAAFGVDCGGGGGGALCDPW